MQCIKQLDRNWKEGNYTRRPIACEGSGGLYCLQYDNEKIISGSRDNTIKVWDWEGSELQVGDRHHRPPRSLMLLQVLKGHTGSVLCLQFDDYKIVSGSSDGTVRTWDLKTGKEMRQLKEHSQVILLP